MNKLIDEHFVELFASAWAIGLTCLSVLCNFKGYTAAATVCGWAGGFLMGTVMIMSMNGEDK